MDQHLYQYENVSKRLHCHIQRGNYRVPIEAVETPNYSCILLSQSVV